MTSGEDHLLSVVVGTLNRIDRLQECIESIVRDASIPIKIYVTDAGSTDGTIDYLRGLESDSISVTLHKKKLGQAKAYNEIFAKVDTPYVCWLSDDNVVIDRGLEKAVRILNANPKIGMVGLKVKDLRGPFSREAYIGGLSETGILNVNQGVLRTGILRGLGGFSEEFMDYGIDPDLTARVLYAGHDIVSTKDVAILHWRDWGESETLRAQMAKQERYKALYRKKYARNGFGEWPSRFWFRTINGIKRVLTKWSKLLGSPLRATRWTRDWYNCMLGRYISPIDPIRSMGKEFHLLQRCDRETIAYYANRLHQGGLDSPAPSGMTEAIPVVAIFGQLLQGSAGGIETNLLKLIVAVAQQNGPDDRQLVIGPGGESSWLRPYLGQGQDVLEWPPLRCEMPVDIRTDMLGAISCMVKNGIRITLRRGLRSAFSNMANQLTHDLKRAGVEVVHFPYQRYFPTNLPFIFEPWDLQHIHLPELFSSEEVKFRDWLYRKACKEATLVVTATHWTKKDLVSQFDLPASKIAVIPRGAEISTAKFSPLAIDSTLAKLKLPKRYALYPAKTWAHKNHMRLFQALAHLRDQKGLTVPLVCTGKPIKTSLEDFHKALRDLGLIDQVFFTGFLNEGIMQHLYVGADQMIFPSLFEGLGIPVLEAMTLGTPVVCSRASCLPEICGEAAVLFDPYSVEDMAAKIAMVWSDSALRSELKQRGYANITSFSWAEAARSFRVAYNYVTNRRLGAEEERRLATMLS